MPPTSRSLGSLEDIENFLHTIADALCAIERQNRYAYTESHGEYGSVTRRIHRESGALEELWLKRNPEQSDHAAADYWRYYWQLLVME
jgi:hypothetical protein